MATPSVIQPTTTRQLYGPDTAAVASAAAAAAACADQPNAFITQNGRTFTCTSVNNANDATGNGGGGGGGIGIGGNGFIPSIALSTQNQLNSIFSGSALRILDTEALRQNLSHVSTAIREVYDDVMSRMNTIEHNIELNVYRGEIPSNFELYNKLTVTVPKIKQAKKSLLTWHTNIQDDLMDVGESLRKYDGVVGRLNSTLMTTTSATMNGLGIDELQLARQNLTKSRAMQRAVSQLAVIDTRIRNEMQALQLNLNEMASGVLRSSNTDNIVNLRDIMALITGLYTDNSPLTRVQRKLAGIINNTPVQFKLDTIDMRVIDENTIKVQPNVYNDNQRMYIQPQSEVYYPAPPQPPQVVPTITRINDSQVYDFNDINSIAAHLANYQGNVEGGVAADNIENIDDSTILVRLNNIQNDTIMTPEALHNLNKLESQIMANLTAAPLYSQIIEKISDIRKTNMPEPLLMTLRQMATNPGFGFTARSRASVMKMNLLRNTFIDEQVQQLNKALDDIIILADRTIENDLNSSDTNEVYQNAMFTEYNTVNAPNAVLSRIMLKGLDSMHKEFVNKQNLYLVQRYSKYIKTLNDNINALDKTLPPNDPNRNQRISAIVLEMQSEKTLIDDEVRVIRQKQLQEMRSLFRGIVDYAAINRSSSGAAEDQYMAKLNEFTQQLKAEQISMMVNGSEQQQQNVFQINLPTTPPQPTNENTLIPNMIIDDEMNGTVDQQQFDLQQQQQFNLQQQQQQFELERQQSTTRANLVAETLSQPNVTPISYRTQSNNIIRQATPFGSMSQDSTRSNTAFSGSTSYTGRPFSTASSEYTQFSTDSMSTTATGSQTPVPPTSRRPLIPISEISESVTSVFSASTPTASSSSTSFMPYFNFDATPVQQQIQASLNRDLNTSARNNTAPNINMADDNATDMDAL